jgi:deazaflavin-dependent oxidoreductase (nitroreductase family)
VVRFPNARWLLALITRLHVAAYRASGGRVGAGALGLRFLLLEHTGRRTGRRRTAPLLYLQDAGRFVVVASNAGDARAPAWWRNLEARPVAWVQVGRRRVEVRARPATQDEEARLWPGLLRAWPSYRRYRERAGRHIPVVLLEPALTRARPIP